MNLNDWLKRAKNEGWAIGQFNVSNLEALHAVVFAGTKLHAPLIIGVSEGEREFFGIPEVVAIVKALKDKTGLPIFLNADHTKSFEKVKEAVDAGFDSVHFDGSALSYEENVHQTKRAVEYSKSQNVDISVEGELGYLRGTSRVQEEVEILPEDFTDPEQAADFVLRTGIDRLAPVFGNIHGIVTNAKEKLDLERLRAISAKTNAYLVLHGGSGVDFKDIRQAIRLGVVKINVNTDLRIAYRKALEKVLSDMPDETTPYRLLSPVVEKIQKVVEEKIKIFGSDGKA
ncbi:MAG: ketose-bisphosphate aldolase [Candidatus Paceibacteria bacterium]